jgi:hypothetical protein
MKLLLTLLFATLHTIAFSQGKSIALRFGSTGIGAGYEKKINTKFSLSSSLQLMNLRPSLFIKGNTYQYQSKLTLKFTQLELAAKWYPKAKSTSYGAVTNNKLFIKGGMLIRDNSAYLITNDYQKVTGSSQFDNNNPKNGRLIFDLKTNAVQPFLALGFELINTDHRWSASIEGGLSYHGTAPTVPFENFYETGVMKIYEPNFARWVRVPQIIRLIKVYPLLNFTIGRRF